MSDPTLTEAAASAILRKLDERVRRIDTRVTLIGHTIGAPFNVNTKPVLLPNGIINLPSKHSTIADILALYDGSSFHTMDLQLDGAIIAELRKF